VVSGTLDEFARTKLRRYVRIGLLHYRDWDTYIWQVLPPAAASLFPPKEDTL